MQSGMDSSQACAAALSFLSGLVAKQAAVMACSDLFQIAALLASLGVIAAMLIRDVPKADTKSRAEGAEEAVPVAAH